MAAPDPGEGEGPPPPRAGWLVTLHADAWAELLTHARAVLNELDDQVIGPRLVRLRASPASRLAGGRLREQLARAIAEGGPVWEGLRERLAERVDPRGPLGFLLTGEPPDRPVERVASSPEPAGADGPDAGADVEALRGRIRELVGQRDEARRGRSGAQARADTAQAKLDEREEQIADLRREVERLRAEREELEQEHRRALDRLQRQHGSQLADLREEVRDLRRAEEERRLEERRRDEARRRAERQARASEAPASPAATSGVGAGRPSQVPAGVEPGTAAYAEALLTPGRTVLVDGYNVTLRHRSHLKLAEQRAWLVKLLEGAVARFGVEVEVVFDANEGVPGRTVSSRTVQVRFTEPGVTADDDIVFAVEFAPDDQPILVVTDDRELIERVRAYRVDVVGGAPFLWAVE